MQVQLVSQPYAAGRNAVDFLTDSLADERVESLDVVVAWAKRSGVRQVAGLLAGFRARGGRVRFIVGVSQGGATRQGLELAMRESDEAYVFHDRSGRTFHPKLYRAYGPDVAHVLIGSQNLTRGGVVENYELGVEVRADPHAAADQEFLRSVGETVDGLLAEAGACVPLTPATLRAILDDPELEIQDEDRQAGDVTPRRPGRGETAPGTPFGRVFARLRRARGVVVTRSRRPAPGGPAPSGAVVRRWFKQLDRSNAQRLPGTSSPTGHLTLTKANLDIDAATYFRDEFFAECDWAPAPSRGGREFAIVTFRVVVGAEERGELALQVDNHPAFGSNQGNRVATLRWGSELSHHLRHEADHTGQYVIIEALDDGRFTLVIAAGVPGPAIV